LKTDLKTGNWPSEWVLSRK